MAEAMAAGHTILKILAGAQAGAEVSLSKGDYALGSGSDDDIQIIDVSAKPGHARLQVSAGKIEIKAAAGSLRTANGVALEPGSDWHEIEPLDVVTVGTTRFALGPPTAQWTSITDADTPSPADSNRRKRPSAATPLGASWLPRGRHLTVPLAALALLIGFSLWQFSTAGISPFAATRQNRMSDVDTVRTAIADLPFKHNVVVRQDVDQVIFVSGFVEEPVQRRAVLGAVDKSGVPGRVRVAVLQSMRSEIDNLIRAESVNVTATVTDSGELILDGVILSEQNANRFLDLVKDRMLGASRIESRIKTAKSLLGEAEKLATVSQIGGWVLLRNDGELIEATGAIPLEKVDAWLGFLQAYANRLAKVIGLRSYVQLQDVAGGAAPHAIVIGGDGRSPSDIQLDVERLRQGLYGTTEVLAGKDGKPGGAPADAASNKTASKSADAASTRSAASTAAESSPNAQPSAPAAPLSGDINTLARQILEQWQNDQLGADKGAVKRALEALPDARRDVTERLLPLVASRNAGSPDACWPDAHLTSSNVSAALFWLDLLSVSETLSLVSFDANMQILLLEAALNPRRTETCVAKAAAGRPMVQSQYLAEVYRNPEFVRYLIRDLRPFTLDITGANVGAKSRYVQVRSGRKFSEGAAPDRTSRLALVGELGVAIQVKEGLSSVVFGPEMSWVSD